MPINTKHIFTSQGWLEEALDNPGLDLVMNIFRVPRVFAVGGFDGTWSVGKHSFLTAVLVVFWARFCGWDDAKRNLAVLEAIFHDIHESVSGDMLPFFKTEEVKKELKRLQKKILTKLKMEEHDWLAVELKLLDDIAFLYEIKQAPVRALDAKQVGYANQMATAQKRRIMKHCRKTGLDEKKVKRFLRELFLP